MSVIQSVLLVDDSDDDEFFYRHALGEVGYRLHFYRLKDGVEAMNALQHIAPYQNTAIYPLPDLIISDLDMPRCGGLELLKWMRGDHCAHLIPVVVISSSCSTEDIKSVYRLGGNAFISKPTTLAGLAHILIIVLEFWQVSQLPQVLPGPIHQQLASDLGRKEFEG